MDSCNGASRLRIRHHRYLRVYQSLSHHFNLDASREVSATPIYVATSNSAESYYIYGVVPPSVGSLTYHRAFDGDLTIGGSDTLIYLDGVPSLHDSDITIVGAATNSISWTLDSVNGGLGLAFANT